MIKILPRDILGISHRIPWKNQNVVYHLQISALVPEISKFEKCVKYANEMTDDIIHPTQYYIKYINRAIWSRKFAVQAIETWQANSSTGNTSTAAIKSLFPWQLTIFQSPSTWFQWFQYLSDFQLANVKQDHKLELTYMY